MNIAEKLDKLEQAETPIAVQIGRVVLVAVAVAVTAWLAASFALDWLGAPFLK